MILYDIRTALLGFRRSPLLTAVIVGGLGLGIGVATLFSAVRHVLAKVPMPHKADRVCYVQLDNWDPEQAYPSTPPGDPPPQVSYRDMVEIMKSDIPVRHGGTFKGNLWVFPEEKGQRPSKEFVRLVFSDFFEMFEVPFRYGGPWGRDADAGPEPVAVLSEAMNRTLFGGANSVGRTVRIEDRVFRVVGVLDHWNPTLRYYDLTQDPFGQTIEPVFIPFQWVLPLEIRTAGNADGWKSAPDPTFAGMLASEDCWIQMWAEFDDPAKIRRYHEFLDAYAMEQRKAGRFLRPINNRVRPLPEYMEVREVVPKEITALAVVSLLFLAVCALNLTGLLLAKFLARAPEVGVRRALGARRVDVFVQHIVECETAALAGGAVGLVLALVGMFLLNEWIETALGRENALYLDVPMLAMSIGLALLAGLVAGVYPAWRVCRTAPAMHLKLQ